MLIEDSNYVLDLFQLKLVIVISLRWKNLSDDTLDCIGFTLA
jgi:hypothetical protein